MRWIDLFRLSVLHPLVDACSVAVAVSGGLSVPRVVAYNAIAFMLQLPLGALLDARPHLTQLMFRTSLALTFVGTAAAFAGSRGWLTLAVVCLGNAFFHLAAGKHIMDKTEGRTREVTVFIATGAFGLLAGRWMASWNADPALFLFAALLVIGAVCSPKAIAGLPHSVGAARTPRFQEVATVVALFVLTVWRSWEGLHVPVVTPMFSASGVCAVGVSALAQVVGAEIGDLFGIRLATAICAVGGLSLFFVFGTEMPLVRWALNVFVPLGTGPALAWLYACTGRRSGLSFGLNCFALFLGTF